MSKKRTQIVAAGLDQVVEALKQNPYGLLYTDLQKICKQNGGNAQTVLQALSVKYDLCGDGNGGYYLLSEREKYLRKLREEMK